MRLKNYLVVYTRTMFKIITRPFSADLSIMFVIKRVNH